MRDKEKKEVYRANQAFYDAFESLDIKAMEKVWLNAGHIQCIHPGWGLLKGWEPVMASWRRIFENTQEVHFMLTEVDVEVRDSLARVTLYENITSRVGQEIVSGLVLTTNLYQRTPEGWLMIHHHGSTVVQPHGQANPKTFH